MKKHFFSKRIFSRMTALMMIALLGVAMVGCGNGDNNQQGAGKAGELSSYSEIPFAVTTGKLDDDTLQSLIVADFPLKWNDETFDVVDYYDYFRKNYAFGGMEAPLIPEGLKLTLDFGGYEPDKITVLRDTNTFDVLSAKGTPDAEKITEVDLGKDNSFTVNYDGGDMAYYLIQCEWNGVGAVNYGFIVALR